MTDAQLRFGDEAARLLCRSGEVVAMDTAHRWLVLNCFTDFAWFYGVILWPGHQNKTTHQLLHHWQRDWAEYQKLWSMKFLYIYWCSRMISFIIRMMRPPQWTNAESYVTSGLSEPWSLNQFKSLWARSSNENNAPANRISRRQNLYMTVTSFPTHTQRKKLKFSETTLSFAVKVKLSTVVCLSL